MPPKKAPFVPTYTLTFCECGENHVGNQQVGKIADRGYRKDDLRVMLRNMQKLCKKMRSLASEDAADTDSTDDVADTLDSIIIDLKTGTLLRGNDVDELDNDHPWVLYVPRFLSMMTMDYDEFVNMLDDLEFDKKALMYGRVVNKKARHNLIFGPDRQEPDYENGKGTIEAYENLPDAEQLCCLLMQVRDGVDDYDEISGDSDSCGDESPIDLSETPSFIGCPLYAELNKYYAPKTGIGYHGDTERRTVMGVRIGPPIPLVFKWYQRNTVMPDMPIVQLDAGYGDLYIMSEDAVGYNWKKSSIPTLRHAAGSEEYIGKLDPDVDNIVRVDRSSVEHED